MANYLKVKRKLPGEAAPHRACHSARSMLRRERAARVSPQPSCARAVRAGVRRGSRPVR